MRRHCPVRGRGASAQGVMQSSLVAPAPLLGSRRRARASGKFLRPRWLSLSENLCSLGVYRATSGEENEIPASAPGESCPSRGKSASAWSGSGQTSPPVPGLQEAPPGPARLKSSLPSQNTRRGCPHGPTQQVFLEQLLVPPADLDRCRCVPRGWDSRCPCPRVPAYTEKCTSLRPGDPLRAMTPDLSNVVENASHPQDPEPQW